MWRWGRARAVGVCGIGATEGAGPTFSAMEGGYVGHETNAGCPRPEIELSPCIKTGKNNKHDETEGKKRTRANTFLNNF